MDNAHATEATRRLGIALPIIQGPFGGGLSSVELAATVSNLGGLGSFGAHNVAPDEIGALVQSLKSGTAKPFNLNLWVSDHDPGGREMDEAAFEKAYRIYEPYFAELGVPRPTRPDTFTYPFEAQIDALLEARPPIFSFVYGIPTSAILAACRQRDIVTVGTATTVAEAEALDAAGVDAIVATGFEAGGHRVSFLAPAEDSLMGTFALTQLAARRVKAPVIAAGGIADGAGVRAALTLGGQAAQIGTAFLACRESGTTAAHRDALFGAGANDTALTRTFTGRLGRGLRNRWMIELDPRAAELPPYPIPRWFAGQLRAAALKAGRTDLVPFWSGQIAANLEHRSAIQLMGAMVRDLDEVR
jgi:nitronate monooxygenase